jgi:hypothetical protein
MAVTTITTTLTVNAAFLKEIKDVNQELWEQLQALRDHVKRRITTSHQARQCVDLIARLRDNVAMHFALEEACGYFEDPVYVAPWLNDRAQELRQQHPELYQRVCHLFELAERLMYRGRFGGMTNALLVDLEQFYADISAHESAEIDLVFQAYDEDIGVGD